jgi:hypothetical protein
MLETIQFKINKKFHVKIMCYLLFPTFLINTQMCNYVWLLYFPPLLHQPVLKSWTVCCRSFLAKGSQGMSVLSMMIQTWAPDTESLCKSSFCWILQSSVRQWPKARDYSQIIVILRVLFLSLHCFAMTFHHLLFFPTLQGNINISFLPTVWFKDLRFSNNRIS